MANKKAKGTVQSRILDYLMDPYEAINSGHAVAEIAHDLCLLEGSVGHAIRRLRDHGILDVELNERGYITKIWIIEGAIT